ncbi:hypothetical protein [Lentzea albidocapillata]|uniref:Uncharacterized protein n=1 Tax=Lentzea albidocapillata TaxID=40571 RepID=A0A1W2FRS0_9PSEU|nr:hypothetical protein [Lentzea albidocapillata]SMD24563.1 hypothetical protein SAMN05660733_07739 [Lentzea albidocapillata]
MTTFSPVRTGVLPAGLLTEDLGGHPETVAFLRELARVRRLPLSVPLAFNALAFRFDLDRGKYTSDLVETGELPVIAADQVIAPMPVGATARLDTGGEPVLCEVVFRHGEHPALDPDGKCPPWLSGAPAAAVGPGRAEGAGRTAEGVVLKERLVVDATALGSGQPNRLRRLFGGTLNPDGHLVVRSAYVDDEQAELDDVRLFVSHLLRQRTAEVREALRPVGPVADDHKLADTLHRVFDALATLLDATGLLRWREMYLHPETYEQWFAGDEDTRGVDPADVDQFSRLLASACLPVEGRRFGGVAARPAYLAIGPALRESIRDPEDPDLPTDALRGPRYATTLVCAQLYLVEKLSQGQPGVITLRGKEVHVRLDDAWQGAGVWRAELSESIAGELRDQVDLPLALGWLGSAEPARVEHEESTSDESAELGAIPSPRFAEADTEELLEQSDGVVARDRWVDDTTLAWQFYLGPRHSRGGVLPLTPKVAEEMRAVLPPEGDLQLDISHPGTELDPAHRRQRVRFDGRRLHGVQWPDSMFLGIRLTASWCADSFQVKATSTALETPVDVEGIPIDYEFDAAVLLRYLADPVDLEDTGEVLSMPVLRGMFSRLGLRVGQGAPELFVPLTTLVREVTTRAQSICVPVPTVQAVCAAVGELVAEEGTVRVDWRVLLSNDDGQGDWLTPRRRCEPDWEWQADSCSRAEPIAADLAVVLSLHPSPADRPCRAPALDSGVSRSDEDFLRRGHLRSLPSGRSPKQRELAIRYAKSIGLDPATISPQITYVSESGSSARKRSVHSVG